MKQVQVQLRVPVQTVKRIDIMVKKGKFASRSDAIKSMIASFEEREKTRAFYNMLLNRSQEAAKNPSSLVPLED